MNFEEDSVLKEQQELLGFLSSFITENRFRRFKDIINDRTRYLTVILENIYQSHNASAVLRSCECFGIQDVHVLEYQHTFKSNHDIALGADKWLTLKRYKTREESQTLLNHLKNQGYRLVVTSPHIDSYNLDNLPLNQKIALAFGTELEGISNEISQQADCFLRIPMVGLTESLNISVSAAIILYTLSWRIKNSDLSWGLSETEQTELLLDWTRKTLSQPDILENQFKKMKGS